MNFIHKLSSKLFSVRIGKMFGYIAENDRKYYSSLKLNQILSEAEKEIRVPMTHFNVRHLLKDEFDLKIFTDIYINKVNTKYISESNHPIVEIARDLCGSVHTSVPTEDKTPKSYVKDNTGSLLLLLLAKVCESLPSFKPNEAILKKLYNFYEIYELINKALFIHHSAVVNIPMGSTHQSLEGQSDLKRLKESNKISILGGDYLLSYAVVRLANLVNNTAVLQLIMCAIDDYCIYHFNNIEDRADGLCIPSYNMSAGDWEEMAGYSLTKLFAYCSQIMLLMAKQSDRYQKASFDFGYNLKLIWSLRDEIDNFCNTNTSPESELNLMSAPVIFHIQYDKNFHNYLKECLMIQNLNFSEIRQMIISGPAIDKCNRYLEFYTNKAIKSLEVFPDSNAKSILQNAIFA